MARDDRYRPKVKNSAYVLLQYVVQKTSKVALRLCKQPLVPAGAPYRYLREIPS